MVQTFVDSPTTRGILAKRGFVQSSSDKQNVEAMKSAMADLADGLGKVKAAKSTDQRPTYVQVCMQLRYLRFFMCLRKIAKIARSTIFRIHLRFFAILSLVNAITRKRVANFAKTAKNRKANDFSRSLVIFRSSVIRNDYPAQN